MHDTVWDPHDVLVTLGHPFGDIETSLHEWMLSGPGLRRLVRPVAARSRQTGETLPLSVIPLAYRNNGESRSLIAAGELESPWPSLPTVGNFLLPEYGRYNALLGARYLSHGTVAECGRLITATARLSELLLAQVWGHIDGPQGWPIEEARAVLKGFDEAWARYEAEFADYHPRQADERLKAAVKEAVEGIEALVARFPER